MWVGDEVIGPAGGSSNLPVGLFCAELAPAVLYTGVAITSRSSNPKMTSCLARRGLSGGFREIGVVISNLIVSQSQGIAAILDAALIGHRRPGEMARGTFSGKSGQCKPG